MKNIKKIVLWSAIALTASNGVIGMEPQAIANRAGVNPTQRQVNNARMCPICLANFQAGQNLVALACNNPAVPHIFHTQCLEGWIRRGQLTCPLCRAAIPQMIDNRSSMYTAGLNLLTSIALATVATGTANHNWLYGCEFQNYYCLDNNRFTWVKIAPLATMYFLVLSSRVKGAIRPPDQFLNALGYGTAIFVTGWVLFWFTLAEGMARSPYFKHA